MKSSMPYHGVTTPVLRGICREVFAGHDVSDPESWARDVLGVWRAAKFREERYAAIGLTGDRRATQWQTLAALPMYEEMIVTGAWWDFVDVIATHRLYAIARREGPRMKKVMLAWSRAPDIWKRRSAILCQNRAKADTDLELLYACIEPSVGRPEFFLRKAIGWALRQYAWTDPQEVRRYVRENEDRLAPLSVREALKNVTSSRARAGHRKTS